MADKAFEATLPGQRPLSGFVSLSEATVDEKGIAEVCVIRPGFNLGKGRFYPAAVLKRDCHIFEGVKMYANHPSVSEMRDRPERSINDWVGHLTEVRHDEEGNVFGRAVILDDAFKQKLRNLKEAGLLGEMGVSIRGLGKTRRTEIEGHKTEMVEALTAGHSADYVTQAGAGGAVQMFEADRSHYDERNDDMEEIQELKDTVSALEKKLADSETALDEANKALESKAGDESKAVLEAVTKERDELKAKIEEADKAKVREAVTAEISKAIQEAKLPDVSKERMTERFKDADTADGLTEAITSEQDYVKSLIPSGQVSGLGGADGSGWGDKAALIENRKQAYIAEGKTPEVAEKMARAFFR